MAPSKSNSTPTVVVGIDFGTTHSGIAFCSYGNVDSVQAISHWQSYDSASTDKTKVPSAIHFGGASHDDVTWGNTTTQGKEPVQWFKLLLLREEDRPDYLKNCDQIQKAEAQLAKLNMPPVEVVAKYLRVLWDFAETYRMRRAIGDSYFNIAKIHIVMTIPAIWPEYAIGLMREAASRAGLMRDGVAGLRTLDFINEPEAAALATLTDMKARKDLKRDDSFVIVDCGGGTVDLISYKVSTARPLRMNECVQGTGALCGAMFVDIRFIQLLHKKLANVGATRVQAKNIREILTREWESGIKAQFTGDANQTWSIHVPFDTLGTEARMQMGFTNDLPEIEFTSSDIRGVFQPVIDRIIQLVDQQVQAVRGILGKDPKFIILVGGFGRCEFLFRTLKQKFKVEILQSDNSLPWTAVCRGAVMHGLAKKTPKQSETPAVMVQSRVARASYGYTAAADFDPQKHLERDRFYHDVEGCYKARNQMDWFVRKGESVADQKPIRYSYRYTYQHLPPSIDTEILKSEVLPVPTRNDENVHKFCVVKWNLKGIDFKNLPRFNDTAYRVVDFQIEMSAIGNVLEFVVYHGGKKLGKEHVQVEYSTQEEIEE